MPISRCWLWQGGTLALYAGTVGLAARGVDLRRRGVLLPALALPAVAINAPLALQGQRSWKAGVARAYCVRCADPMALLNNAVIAALMSPPVLTWKKRPGEAHDCKAVGTCG